MKNLLRFLGITAFAAVIGFGAASCGDGEGGDKNSGDTDNTGNTGGGGNKTLIITGISSKQRNKEVFLRLLTLLKFFVTISQ